MSFWDRNTTFYRLIIALLSIILLTISITNFIKTISTKTDQNLYEEPPSRFYLTKIIPAEITEKNKSGKWNGKLLPGNLILKVNGMKPENIKEIIEIINKSTDEKVIFDYIDNKDINTKSNRGEYFSTKQAVINKNDIPEDFLLYLSSAAIIIYIEKGGVSDRAGLKVGDYIVKVNGESFKSILEANKYIEVGESGSILTYDILRNNNFFECKVEIVKFDIPINFLILFIVGLICIAFGLVLAESKPKLRTARLLGLGFITLGFFISPIIFRFNQNGFIAYLSFYLFLLCSSFCFAFLVNGLAYFPRERTDIIKKGWVIRSPYIFGALLILFSVLNLYVFKAELLDNILRFAIRTSIGFFFIYYFIVLLIYRKSRSKEEAGLSRAINITFGYLLILSVLVIVLSFFKIVFPATILYISLVFFPLSFIYTIGRYKLLNLEFRVRKNIRYMFISSIWKLVLIIMIIVGIWQVSRLDIIMPNLHFTGSSIEVLDHPLSQEEQDLYHNIIIIFLALLGVVVFRYINKRGQNNLDKKYFRVKFDYRKASAEFSEILDRNISINDLAGNLIYELAHLVHLKKAGIIFYKNEEFVIAQNFYGYSNESIIEYCRITATQQIANIKKFNSEYRVDYLDEPMRGIYLKHDFKYVIPIRSKEKVLGALLVGDKLSEVPYHREDLEFLNTIAGQISVAIENAMLYEELTVRERIKHELELARRIQLASLPKDIPDIDGLDVSGITIPAHEVGGDFYDFLQRNGTLTVIVGDVSGKGTSAALYMSKAQGIMRTLHEFDLSPKELFLRSNLLLYKYMDKSSFITAICADINTSTRTINFSRAGHLPLFYFSTKDNKVHILQSKGMVLGMTKSHLFESNLEEIKMQIEAGDIFLFISDGVTEARNSSGQEFNYEKIVRILNKYNLVSSESIRDRILDTIKDFSENETQFDDITIVVIKVK